MSGFEIATRIIIKILSFEERGGGVSRTQKCVYQKWPDQIFPIVFSRNGLGGGDPSSCGVRLFYYLPGGGGGGGAYYLIPLGQQKGRPTKSEVQAPGKISASSAPAPASSPSPC